MLAMVVVLLIVSLAIPHMYTRIWFPPVILALIAYARPRGQRRVSLQQLRRMAEQRDQRMVEG